MAVFSRLMGKFYTSLSGRNDPSLVVIGKSLRLSLEDMFLIASVFNAENGGFKLKTTNYRYDPGELTIGGITLKNNPEISIWNELDEVEQFLLLINVYQKYLSRISSKIDVRLRLVLFHSIFVGFDTLIACLQAELVEMGHRLRIDGIYGKNTEAAILSAKTDIDKLLYVIDDNKQMVSIKEADQVKRFQKANDLPVKDLSKGYFNRLSKVMIETNTMVA